MGIWATYQAPEATTKINVKSYEPLHRTITWQNCADSLDDALPNGKASTIANDASKRRGAALCSAKGPFQWYSTCLRATPLKIPRLRESGTKWGETCVEIL